MGELLETLGFLTIVLIVGVVILFLLGHYNLIDNVVHDFLHPIVFSIF